MIVYLICYGISFILAWQHLYVLSGLVLVGAAIWLYIRDYIRTGNLIHLRGLFCLFLDSSIQGKIGSVAVRIAPYTLGVYLLHENLGVRYAWQKWLGVEQIDGVLPLLLWMVLVVVVVFVLGILVDFVRKAICDGLHKIFLHIRPYRSLTEKIRDVDTMFKREVME